MVSNRLIGGDDLKKLLMVLPIALCLSGSTHAVQFKKLCKGIFPKNNLWLGVGLDAQGISEATFNAVLDKVVAVYNPIVTANGFTLQFNRLWSDGTVNSDTDVEGGSWVINSYGGLARYAGMTADGYAAVACHELGHHLGGAPLFDGDVMSVEGEADYHVGTKCLRKIFAQDDNVKVVQGLKIDPLVVSRCTASFSGDAKEIALCERSAQAGFIVADILRQLDGSTAVAFNTPDPSQVDQTFQDHPAAQCRLDTYFNSTVCEVSSDVAFSQTDEKTGACVTGNGARPRCWYSPASSN
jgi:hypothetical protein